MISTGKNNEKNVTEQALNLVDVLKIVWPISPSPVSAEKHFISINNPGIGYFFEIINFHIFCKYP